MSDTHRSRQRIAGRKISDPIEYKRQVEQAVLDGVRLGFSLVEIAKQIGKSRTQTWRIVKRLSDEGKVRLTETGRVERTDAQVEQKAYEELETDSFVQAHPSVKRWVDDMSVRDEGKPLTITRQRVNNLKVMSDVLKTNPEAFIVNRESAEQFYKSFVLEFRKVSTANPHHHLMSLRNYAMANGIVWGRGAGGLMSGKKVQYGQYAHVQLTDAQIVQLTELAQTWGDIDLRDWFAFGCETGPRHTAERDMDIGTYEIHDGFSTLRAFESKTRKSQGTWTKYFVNPTVQRYLQERINTQRAAGRSKLFQDHMTDSQFSESINQRLKKLYKAANITEPYFYKEPTHVLRHIAAHHWLRLTDYNYSLVAKILGWKSEGTLRESYGEMPGEVLLSALKDAQRRQTQK